MNTVQSQLSGSLITRDIAPLGDDDLRRRLEIGAVATLVDRPFDCAGLNPCRLAESSDGRAKSISYDPRTRALKGAGDDGPSRALLATLLENYAGWALQFVRKALPSYAPALTFGRTSFRHRPADHAMSPRKDDRRLHVDAFPSQPVQGRRILRVFHNCNPAGEARVWHVGECFADHVARFLPRIASGHRAALPAWFLQAAGLTKGRRTSYDALMLALHDAAKADDAYQAEAPRQKLTFAPGATWLAFTDAVPHAAISGRFALEQTFLMPVEAMALPDAAPVRVLELMIGRRLT